MGSDILLVVNRDGEFDGEIGLLLAMGSTNVWNPQYVKGPLGKTDT